MSGKYIQNKPQYVILAMVEKCPLTELAGLKYVAQKQFFNFSS